MSKKQTVNELEEGASFSLSSKSAIVTDTNVYEIELFDPSQTPDDFEFKDDVAYINNGYYYLYRGKCNSDSPTNLKPGIYERRHPSKDEPKCFIVEPMTDKEQEEYDVQSHAASLNPVSIIDIANNKEEILVAIPESTKIFQPTLSESDDILKRVAKLALIKKNVDLDRYKDRFTDKNALFNFKQVIKGDNKLSILIFNRGCDALNLKYTLTLEEKDDTNYVGEKLAGPIVVSSEDTYEI